ncbi:uncharacterized protein LOC110454497 isoform X1 [Mizuhopecten yessoensis]|nr:uncharacterized protein LOC110454497 isoform X1 [Mizuhopecten yessoensis]
MYRPNRWKSWNFGFSDIPERPYSQTNISSDSIYEDDEAAPVHRTALSPGLGEQRQSKAGYASSPGLDEQRQSKGFMKKILGFFKRIKLGGKKRSVTKGLENWEFKSAYNTPEVEQQEYTSYKDNQKPTRPRSYPFSGAENAYVCLDDGTEFYRRTISSGIHTDYGSIGGYNVKRTRRVAISDTISRAFTISEAGTPPSDYPQGCVSIEPRAGTPPSDYSLESEESKMSELMNQSQLDVNCEHDFLHDSKGFPFNVARLLAIKLKLEERFVVPTTDASGKHTFIIYDKEQGRDRITTELGQEVLIRNPKSIKSEGLEITNYCREIRLDIKPSQRTLLKRIIQKHADELFTKHSNINFIGTSPVKSWRNGNNVRNEECIVIYCSSKGFIPFGEETFPTQLTVGEVTASTDIREGYFQFGPYAYTTSRSSDIHDRLKMGCQFGVEGGSGSGTIGPFVNFNGNLAFLTCAHIIYGIDENGYTYDDPAGNIKIEQPSSVNFGSTGNRCGKVTRAVFRPDLPSSVDAAVVEITEQSRQPVSGEFAVDNPIRMQHAGFDDLPYFNSGKIHMNPNTIDSDKRMVKFGSETHVTRGTLISEGTVVTPVSTEMGLFGHTGRKVLMRNQMEIAGLTSHGAVFQPGDSGSGVFFVDRTGMGQELTCIGMAIGSTSNGTAVVTPIVDILDALQLPRSLWQFP